jgi:hypothetical protein
VRVFRVGREILPVSGRIALRQAKKGESEEGEEERGRGEGGTKPRRRPAADESWRPGRRAKKKTCPGLQVVRGLSSSLRCARPAVEWRLRVRTRVSCLISAVRVCSRVQQLTAVSAAHPTRLPVSTRAVVRAEGGQTWRQRRPQATGQTDSRRLLPL